jgi:transcriptional regulator with XRE-family HTH domain
MRKERLSQRQLAARLGLSQGHVSRVLRGKIERETKAFASLASWAASPASELEARLLEAAHTAAGGERRGLEVVMHLMHLIAELRGSSVAQRSRRTVARTRG